MSKVLVPKKMMEHMKKHHHKKYCSKEHKKHFTLLSILAVSIVATSAMSWIAFINFKHGEIDDDVMIPEE